MDSDSRKAQRNSFAHHRAERLAVPHSAVADDPPEWFVKPDSVGMPVHTQFFAWHLPPGAQGATVTL